MNTKIQRNYLKGNLVAASFPVILFFSYNLTFYWIEPFVRSGWKLQRLLPISSGIGAVFKDIIAGSLIHLALAIVMAAFFLIPIILLSTLLEGFLGLMTLWRRPIPIVITIIVLVAIGFAWGFIERIQIGNAPVSI